jgi:hypothetical protein
MATPVTNTKVNQERTLNEFSVFSWDFVWGVAGGVAGGVTALYMGIPRVVERILNDCLSGRSNADGGVELTLINAVIMGTAAGFCLFAIASSVSKSALEALGIKDVHNPEAEIEKKS